MKPGRSRGTWTAGTSEVSRRGLSVDMRVGTVPTCPGIHLRPEAGLRFLRVMGVLKTIVATAFPHTGPLPGCGSVIQNLQLGHHVMEVGLDVSSMATDDGSMLHH